jgi:F-type H+-transporting ATPase subunit delta
VNRSDPAAIPYAQALIEIGREQSILGDVLEQMEAIHRLVEESRDFRLFFLSPSIDPGEKYRIVENLLGDRLNRTVLGFLRIVFRKKREPLFDNILDRFAAFKDETENRIRVHVRSAKELPGDLREKLTSRIGASTGKQVVLEASVDPDLLGGAIIRVGDRRVDGSVRSRLRELRKQLRSSGQMWAQDLE